MIFPEKLYELTDRDAAGNRVELGSLRNDFALNLATFSDDFSVPIGRSFIFQNALLRHRTAGVGVSITLTRLLLVDRDNNELVSLFHRVYAGGTQDSGWIHIPNFQVVVPNMCKVRHEVQFSAADATNRLSYELYGLLIPFGGVSR